MLVARSPGAGCRGCTVRDDCRDRDEGNWQGARSGGPCQTPQASCRCVLHFAPALSRLQIWRREGLAGTLKGVNGKPVSSGFPVRVTVRIRDADGLRSRTGPVPIRLHSPDSSGRGESPVGSCLKSRSNRGKCHYWKSRAWGGLVAFLLTRILDSVTVTTNGICVNPRLAPDEPLVNPWDDERTSRRTFEPERIIS